MNSSHWSALFDRFEREVDGIDEPAASWHPPAEPMPEEFADRARSLLRRQQERIAEIRGQQDAIAHQLVTLRRVPDAASDSPAYLDVAG